MPSIQPGASAIDDYRTWATAPERKTSSAAKSLISQVVDAIQSKLKNAARDILQRVSARLHEPVVKEANKAEIKTVAKASIMERLRMKQEHIGSQSSGEEPKKKKNRAMDR